MNKERSFKKRNNTNSRPNKFKVPYHNKKKKSDTLNDEIAKLVKKYKEVCADKIDKFTDFPLSSRTKKGLDHGKYEIPTEIQKQSIGLALDEHDILGAAKTGSGKTLAFLIPVLERLFIQKWTPMDGLGALIISPTRELAYQIFGVLRIVGKFHDFSAGLVIGGKHLREEADKINNTNVIICTPGRLLQHMDQTFNFNADNLQILVLDEADRILDMGFQETMNAIIQNLPPKRQTLLFSATQTKSVKDLARLSLSDPMFVSVHENATHSTPTHLTQSYIVCELHEKMNMLWSFIRSHIKMKTLVFLSSCKQVRFVYEALRRMRPGVPLMCLHGAMQQMKRVAVYEGFKNKKHAVLLATDIAARGLDFPAVHWVIQLDCPEDANTYIHRVGRTARYEKNGEALLVLLPSEQQMITQLEAKKIPIEKIEINKEKMKSIQGKIEALCASELELKQFAQRGFVSYLKAVFFMKDKRVFDVSTLDTDNYARSLGLAIVPRIRFLEKKEKQELKRKEIEKVNNTLNSERAIPTKKSSINPFSESDPDGESEDDSPSTINYDAIISKMQSQQKHLRTNSDSENDSSSDDGSFENENSDTESDSSSEEITTKIKTNSSQNISVEGPLKQEVYSFDLDAGDEGDDLLTVKKDGGTVCDESDEENVDLQAEQHKSTKQKTTSKAALAKKLMKKNITVNEKITFDEEGEEIKDTLKKSQIIQDDEENEGGIDICKARARMREEDTVDKQLYKERIKKKHKEERLKAKERKRKNTKQKAPEDDDEEAVAVLGSGAGSGAEWSSAEEDESEQSGSETGSRSSGQTGDQSDESQSDDYGPPMKRARKSMIRTEETRAVNADRSVQEDELMALHLLSAAL